MWRRNVSWSVFECCQPVVDFYVLLQLESLRATYRNLDLVVCSIIGESCRLNGNLLSVFQCVELYIFDQFRCYQWQKCCSSYEQSDVVVVSVGGGESKFLYLSPNALSIVEEAAFHSGMCECSLCASMTMSDVNNQWRSNFQQQII